jgi:hypothetical protein
MVQLSIVIIDFAPFIKYTSFVWRTQIDSHRHYGNCFSESTTKEEIHNYYDNTELGSMLNFKQNIG